MKRLPLLNGAPGVGGSTLARRWAAEHPCTFVCDIDVLRTWIGGWRSSFVEVRAAIRPAAQALIGTCLASGDAVLPQLIASTAELDSFAHVVLRDAAGSASGRFDRRSGDDPWHAEVQAPVAASGGPALRDTSRCRLLTVESASHQVTHGIHDLASSR